MVAGRLLTTGTPTWEMIVPLGAALPYEVHDYRAHHVAGVAQEVVAVADVQAPQIGEAQVGLVDQ